LVAALGCDQVGLLYPGDELRENPSGYGLVVIGADASIRLHTLEVCSEYSCLVIGPFMQVQEAYLVRLLAGEHCLTEVSVEFVGSVSGGGAGVGGTWRPKDACFPVSDGRLSYVGSFTMGERRPNVVRHPDIRALLLEHYPGLQIQDIDETPLN
jgi:hypothetical protein